MVSRADGFRKGPNTTPGTSGRMKRCSRRWRVILVRHRANSRTSKPGDRGPHLPRRPGLPPVFLQLVADRCAAVARKAKRQEWEFLLGRSNCLDPAYRKNGFPFPPGRSLGVSFFSWGRLRDPGETNPLQIALGRRVAVAARLLDALLGVIVDGPAVAAARGVDVNRPGIDEIATLGGKGYLIMNRLAVVGKLDGRVVDAVELPEHLQRAG